MPLCSKLKVPMPTSKIVVRRTGKYPTVFKVLSTYRNAQGTPASHRVAIGVLDAETEMLIPNDRYWEFYPSVPETHTLTPTLITNRSVGMSYLFNRVTTGLGLTRILEESLGGRKASLVLTAALYMAARTNVFENVLAYCEGFTLSEPPLTSQTASELFASLTFVERMDFFKRWVAIQPLGSFLAYDVTSFSTYSKGIVNAEWGYNRDGDRLPQINFGCYLSQETHLPIFYVTYSGSISDKSHLPYMMAYNKDLGIKDVGFVLDRGFCSTANVKHMAQEKLDFIMGVDVFHKTTRGAIESVRNDLVNLRNRVAPSVYARPLKSCFYGVTANMHVYFDSSLADDHREDLNQNLTNAEAKLAKLGELSRREAISYRKHFVINRSADGAFTYERDDDKIQALVKNFGYFCLLTNTNLNSAEVLATYRQKDVIEKGFDDLKNHVDMKRLRTQNSNTTDGKMFCAFIALIAVSEIGYKMQNLLSKKSWSKVNIIEEMEKIRIISGVGGKRLADPVTKKQRVIMEQFGLTVEDLEAYVKGDTSKPC